MNSEELQNIFYSGFPAATSWDVLDTLLIAIDRGVVVYQSESITTKDAYRAICDSITAIDGLGPQGKGHMALKQIAKGYLYRTYHVSALNETYFASLHPDVRSEDGQYVIECGTTDPSCVTIYLDDPRVMWMGNITYPFAEDPHLVLHIFSRGNLYTLWREESVSKNRTAFEKYHRR